MQQASSTMPRTYECLITTQFKNTKVDLFYRDTCHRYSWRSQDIVPVLHKPNIGLRKPHREFNWFLGAFLWKMIHDGLPFIREALTTLCLNKLKFPSHMAQIGQSQDSKSVGRRKEGEEDKEHREKGGIE